MEIPCFPVHTISLSLLFYIGSLCPFSDSSFVCSLCVCVGGGVNMDTHASRGQRLNHMFSLRSCED